MSPLTDDMTRLRDDIDALHNNRETFINDLMHNVAAMQSGFRNDHAEMAKKGQDDREAFVSNLRSNVVEIQSNFRNDHAEMARKLIGDLGMFASDLNKTVAGLRQEFASDIEGAHQAWFGQAPRERTTKKETKRKSREEEARRLEEEAAEGEPEEVKAEPEKPEELIPDDLTEIQGIGTSRQKILNEAGLYTFAQFAKSTPEDLKRALGEMSKLVDVEKWIEQAKELVEPE